MTDRASSAIVARSAARDRLVATLGDWSRGSGPLYRQLARALTAAVERGELARGARLPSERAFATALLVSRGVVVAAYDSLVADEIAERRQGSGTFVAGPAPGDLPVGREGSALVGRLVDQGSADRIIDLSISVLHEADGLPPVSLRATGLPAVDADSPWGTPALRARIAERLTAIGLPSTASQVVVTTGAQQGISIAAGCWVRPGDLVVVDDPTYPGALAAFGAAGAEVRGVAVDKDGVVLAEIEAALEDRPALLYLQSGPHSPTGGRLSAHRRKVIAGWLAERRIPLVEDHALFALDWSGRRPPPPLAAHLPEHPIAVVGSYSKRFWAGLRVGFVRAPEPVARRLVRVKATHDLGSSSVSQAMALRLLDHVDHDAFVASRNADLARRCALLVALLAESLPDWSCTVPDGGLSLWVRLPTPTAARFADRALSHGVAVATAEGLSATNRHLDRLRLTFASSESDLHDAVERLAAAWSEVERPGRGGARG